MNENIIATKPRIVVSNSGKWYLYFSIRNPKSGKLEPFKIEKGFKLISDDKGKKEYGEKLKNEYTEKLQRGWTPWRNEECIYEDQIQYKNEADRFGYQKKAKGTVRMFSSGFLLFKKKSLKQKTYSSYQSKMRIFCQWLENNGYGEYDISLITNKIILLFFEYLSTDRDLDKITIKMYRVKIHAFFDYLISNKHIFDNPVFNIPIGKKKKDNAPKPIFPNDLERLLKAIKKDDPQLFLACSMQYFCAIRLGTELRLLKIKHIDFWGKCITINQIDDKRNRQEIINIPTQLFDLITNVYHLQNYDREKYIFSHAGMPGDVALGVNSMRNRFNKIRNKLNLSQEYKYYSLKHTGAGMLLDSGFNLLEIMEHLRHTDIDSTYHYIRKLKGVKSEKIREHFPSPYEKFEE